MNTSNTVAAVYNRPRPAVSPASGMRRGLAVLFSLLLIFSFTMGLGGCALFSKKSTRDPGPTTGVRGTKPYTIKGETYEPLLTADGFYEEGIASWYGKDFHGKTTANGETYDMYGMTAAHKLLPFGTMVKVTSKVNGKSVVVRINDRGPFVANRVIDLTHTAADQIDMIQAGTAPVILETVGTVAGLGKGDLSGNFYVQVGAFASQDNARALVGNLQSRGFAARTYFASEVGFWRVQVGPYPSLNRAEDATGTLNAEFPANFVVAE